MRRDRSLRNGFGFVLSAGFVMLVLSILIPVFLVAMCTRGVNEAESEIAKKEAIVGKQTVIGNDTVTIVDYTVWNDSYKLSNGLNASEGALTKIIE